MKYIYHITYHIYITIFQWRHLRLKYSLWEVFKLLTQLFYLLHSFYVYVPPSAYFRRLIEKHTLVLPQSGTFPSVFPTSSNFTVKTLIWPEDTCFCGWKQKVISYKHGLLSRWPSKMTTFLDRIFLDHFPTYPFVQCF